MRSVVGILALLLLAASSPPQQQRGQPQRESEQAVANSLERIAGVLERNDEPKGYTANCEQGREDRRSDLCAQWKAADAASRAAGWAGWTWWLGLGGIVIGLGTLGAAGAAAYFAKQAADHTRRGADAAEKGLAHSKSQLRATFTCTREDLEWDPKSRTIKTLVDLQNTGATPAYAVAFQVEVWVGSGRRAAFYGSDEPCTLGTIGRNGEINFHDDIVLTARDAAALQRRTKIRIEYTISFVDEFFDRWNVELCLSANKGALSAGRFDTEHCYHIRIDSDEGGPANHGPALEGADCCNPNDDIRR